MCSILLAAGAFMSCGFVEPVYRFVGFSSGTTKGGAGWFGFAKLCAADYGERARMCTTVEVFRTVPPTTTEFGGYGWVHPVLVVTARDYARDFSGSIAETCNGWGVQSTLQGSW